VRNWANTKCAINGPRSPHDNRLKLGKENCRDQNGEKDDETGFCKSLHVDIYYRIDSLALQKFFLPKNKAICGGY
jgi:hypothetical protein